MTAVTKFQVSRKSKRDNSLKEAQAHAHIKTRTIGISIALVIIVGFAVYANSFQGKFIWDDEHLVKNNAAIKNWSYAHTFFSQNIFAGAEAKSNFYRPLQMLSYMLDYSIWRLDVWGYHLSNTTLHILVAVCIYWLMSILYGDNLLSLLTSLLFVVHPIHTEAVTYISGRADPLVSIFMLLCLIFYIKYSRLQSRGSFAIMLLSCILALLSKENSLILPVLLLLYPISVKKRVNIKAFLCIATATLTYIVLRLTVLKPALSNQPIADNSLIQRIPGFFVAITNYVRLLLFPFNLHMEYGNDAFRFTHPHAMLGIAILIFLLMYAHRQYKNNPLIFFSISWFLIMLIPQSNLYAINAYMAEHWLYLPSIGFFLLLAKGLSYIYRQKGRSKFVIIPTVALVIFYSLLTITQNIYWREPIAFYERTLRYVPNSANIYNNLGYAYHSINRYEEAIPLYKKAIELNSRHVRAHLNLGMTYMSVHKPKRAIGAYTSAIKLRPEHAAAHYNLGNAYYLMNENQNAIDSYKKAIGIKPDLKKAHYYLAVVYNEISKRQEAIEEFMKTIELDSNFAYAYFNLGNIYKAENRIKEAMAAYRKTIKIDPGFALAYFNLGNTYYSLSEYEEAIVLYKQAIAAQSDYAEAYYNLGSAYEAIDNKEEALQAYNKALYIRRKREF